MNCRGIRGAITVETNSAEAIITATQHLLAQMVAANHLRADDIASVIFTATPELHAEYPARAARDMGWSHVPLLCMQEMAVLDSLPRCIRVLILWNTDLPLTGIHHVYLGKANTLRPDLAHPASVKEE